MDLISGPVTAELGDDVTIGSACIIGVCMNVNHKHIPDRNQLYLQDGMVQQRVSQTLPQVLWLYLCCIVNSCVKS